MSSEDVIELGSSDEESEPAPKKSKPTPNAMVCIPRKLHEVTIKPAKPKPSSIPKALEGKPITVKKIINPKPQHVGIKRIKSKPAVINPFSQFQKPIVIQNKPSNSKVTLSKLVPPKTISVKTPAVSVLKYPIKIHTPSTLSLPSSITVKKTMANRPLVTLNIKNKQQINQRNHSVGEVLTVELDDDEIPSHNSSPQWYLRPEEQTETSTVEEDNNKEPDDSKLIEITIEDSPVKPVNNKRTHEVGAELAITIDDSPVKGTIDKNKPDSVSDNEDDRVSSSVPHSKKKLKYPKEGENRKTVEIEIDPIEININHVYVKDGDAVASHDDDKNTSTNSKSRTLESNIEKKSDSVPLKDNVLVDNSSSSEFHPIYQSFIDLCIQLENSDDMRKIIEKKIKGYYRQVPKEYTESEEFTDMVSSKILSMKAGPEKMYLYIKDIVDELNLQRKLAKAQPVITEVKNEEPMQIYGEESEVDSKRQRQIRKLEKTIKKLHRAIQKLEEQEVDFDDDDDSVYLLTERYKERMVRVYAKFCQLSNTKMPSEPRIQLDARPGRPSGPAKRLEKWINKKVPIGTPLPFPDFHDVLRCVREANDEDKLGFNEVDIMEEARDLFTRCGKKLQRRRQENEWRLAASRISSEIDPAENNDELKRKLNENHRIAAQKEIEIFNRYADRQNQLKLEAEEIGDKEAEESPVESEEEDNNEENVSLESTEKRKERLVRLLQEKAKKTCEEKENQPSNKDETNENTTQTSETVETDNVIKMEIESKSSENKDAKNKDSKNKDSEDKKDEDPKVNIDQCDNNEISIQKETETYTLSDDSNQLGSDIDELHLLQKLHSENEEPSSTVDSSDSESPIDISDSLESGDNNKEQSKELSDVISIENSSYSENEDENDKILNTQVSNTDSVQFINDDSMPNESVAPTNEDVIGVESCSVGEIVQAPVHTNNDEYNQTVENILLASSEDDSQEGITNVESVNLRDDLISIDDTVVGGTNRETIMQVETELSTNATEKENIDTVSIEVNTDTNIVPVSDDQVEDKLVSSKNDKSSECSTGNNGAIVLDDNSKDSVEKMDVDENYDVVNEMEKLVTPKDNIPATMSSVNS